MFSKVKKLSIEQFKGFKNFDIEINDNTTVLVGANGTGKTTILEIIYSFYSHQPPSQINYNKKTTK